MSIFTWVLRIKLSWSGLQVTLPGSMYREDRSEDQQSPEFAFYSKYSKSEGVPRTTLTVPSLNAGEQHTRIQHSTRPEKRSPKAFTNTTLCLRILNYDISRLKCLP